MQVCSSHALTRRLTPSGGQALAQNGLLFSIVSFLFVNYPNDVRGGVHIVHSMLRSSHHTEALWTMLTRLGVARGWASALRALTVQG